jgi:hypothetical protein
MQGPTETEFNGIGGLQIYVCIVPVRGTFRTGERTFQMQEIYASAAVGGAVIALVGVYSLWALRGRK